MSESLGTARLDLIVDTSAFEAAVSRSRNMAAGLGTAAEEAFQKTTGKARTATEAALRYAASINMTAESWKLVSLGIRGVPLDVLNAVRAAIATQREETEYAAYAARELGAAWAEAQGKARAGAAELQTASQAQALEAEAREARMLGEAYEWLGIQKQHAADGAQNAAMASEAERLRETDRVVKALTQTFMELEAADARAARGEEFVTALQRKATAATLTKTELLELEAAELGVSTAAGPIIASMRAQEQAMESAAEAARNLAAAHSAASADNAFFNSVQKQGMAVGKTRADLLEMEAAERGMTAALAPAIAKLREQEGVLRTSGIQFNQYGLSVKQTQAALRQVPAQMTDIFVGLQGGQNPLTVLIQQGGQLKDVFGGVVPAARALGSGLVSLINPFTVTAAVAATLTVAFFKGSQEASEYRKALAITGNVAGVTASELQDLSKSIATGATTQGQAAAALVLVAKNGKIAADMFGIVAEAAVNMERATGQALDKTITQFAGLAGDPVAAIVKLNEETNFLTLATYEQIKALSDQGDAQGAAALAIESYADTVNQRTSDVEDNLGYLEGAWESTGRAAKTAWDFMLNVGREDSTQEQINKVAARVYDLRKALRDNPNTGKSTLDNWNKQLTEQQAKLRALIKGDMEDTREAFNDAAEQNANNYAVSQKQAILGYASAEEKRTAKITKIRGEAAIEAAKAERSGNATLAAEIRAGALTLEKAINDSAPKKKKKGDGGLANAEAAAALQALKDALAEEQAAIRNSTQVLAAEYSAKLVSTEDYYARTRDLLIKDTAAEEQALVAQIAFLRERNVTGKDAANVLKQLGKLEADLAKVRADGATALIVLGIQEASAADTRARAIEAYKAALDQSNASLEQQTALAVMRVGMGAKEYAMLQTVTAAYAEQAKEMKKLADQLSRKDIDQGQYDAELESLRVATDAKVAIIKDGYDRMGVAEADWRNGMRAGLQDWIDNASNVAGQVSGLMNKSLDSIADAFADLALTGKLNFKALLASILSDITKFLAKQAVLQFVKMFASAYLGGGDTGGGFTSATADSGFAFNAKGGVYASPSLSAYSGQVVNNPTMFAFAKGAGIMGEAGPEAIMPLSRGSDGKLGVKAEGGGSNVVINVNTTVNSDGSASSNSSTSGTNKDAMFKSFADQMRTISTQTVVDAMRPGGMLWRAGVSG